MSKVVRTCKTCKTDFEAVPSNKATYCSKKCMYQRNDAKFKRNCEACGKEFRIRSEDEPTRTCSLECGYKVRHVANKVEHVRWVCRTCGKEQYTQPSQIRRNMHCSKECMFADPETRKRKSRVFTGDKNPAWKGGVSRKVVSESGIRYYRRPIGKEQAKEAKRRAFKLNASVAWADKARMDAIYIECKAISDLTGQQYHVDHIIPLISENVCGLHNEFNLQILTRFDNLSKGNRLET